MPNFIILWLKLNAGNMCARLWLLLQKNLLRYVLRGCVGTCTGIVGQSLDD